MPPEKEPLVDKGKVKQWLAKHWTKPHLCPVSEHSEWIVADHIVTSPLWSHGDVFVGGPSYPLVMLACAGCGYTFFMNATMMGVALTAGTSADG